MKWILLLWLTNGVSDGGHATFTQVPFKTMKLCVSAQMVAKREADKSAIGGWRMGGICMRVK